MRIEAILILKFLIKLIIFFETNYNLLNGKGIKYHRIESSLYQRLRYIWKNGIILLNIGSLSLILCRKVLRKNLNSEPYFFILIKVVENSPNGQLLSH